MKSVSWLIYSLRKLLELCENAADAQRKGQSIHEPMGLS